MPKRDGLQEVRKANVGEYLATFLRQYLERVIREAEELLRKSGRSPGASRRRASAAAAQLDPSHSDFRRCRGGLWSRPPATGRARRQELPASQARARVSRLCAKRP